MTTINLPTAKKVIAKNTYQSTRAIEAENVKHVNTLGTTVSIGFDAPTTDDMVVITETVDDARELYEHITTARTRLAHKALRCARTFPATVDGVTGTLAISPDASIYLVSDNSVYPLGYAAGVEFVLDGDRITSGEYGHTYVFEDANQAAYAFSVFGTQTVDLFVNASSHASYIALATMGGVAVNVAVFEGGVLATSNNGFVKVMGRVSKVIAQVGAHDDSQAMFTDTSSGDSVVLGFESVDEAAVAASYFI